MPATTPDPDTPPSRSARRTRTSTRPDQAAGRPSGHAAAPNAAVVQATHRTIRYLTVRGQSAYRSPRFEGASFPYGYHRSTQASMPTTVTFTLVTLNPKWRSFVRATALRLDAARTDIGPATRTAVEPRDRAVCFWCSHREELHGLCSLPMNGRFNWSVTCRGQGAQRGTRQARCDSHGDRARKFRTDSLAPP